MIGNPKKNGALHGTDETRRSQKFERAILGKDSWNRCQELSKVESDLPIIAG
jgi:hypothetical protein